jgi:hypothetical protein
LRGESARNAANSLQDRLLRQRLGHTARHGAAQQGSNSASGSRDGQTRARASSSAAKRANTHKCKGLTKITNARTNLIFWPLWCIRAQLTNMQGAIVSENFISDYKNNQSQFKQFINSNLKNND